MCFWVALLTLNPINGLCMQHQFCLRPDGGDPVKTPCPDPKKTGNPILVNWNNAS